MLSFFAFIVSLGGTFAAATALGASNGVATAIAWAATLLGSLIVHYWRRAVVRRELELNNWKEYRP